MALSQETKVGLLVLSSLIVLAIGVVLVGDFHLQRGYKINIIYNDISGLQVKAPVKTAGVQIGEVYKIDLVNDKAQVTVWIKSYVKIYPDARATIMSTGLIGTKYMEIFLGTKKIKPLKDGDTLIGIDPMSFDKIISEGLKGFTDLAEAVKSFTGDKELKESLKKIFTNFSNVMEKLDVILAGKAGSIDNIVKNFEEFSQRINQVAVKIEGLADAVSKEDLQTTIKNFRTISEKLDTALTSLNNIAQKIESGQGTVGKLINDEQMADDVKNTVTSLREASDEAKKVLKRIGGIQTYWDYKLAYNSEDTLSRSDFGLRIRPKTDKFYYIAVNNMQSENKNGKYDAGDQKINSITAEIGKDFGPVTLHGGFIKSSGGFGVDWRPFTSNKKFQFETEAYRFNRKVDGKSKAWVNVGAGYSLTNWLNVKVNYEDAFEQKGFNTTLNLVIEDEDIAYLLGLAGLSSLAK